MHRRSQLGHLDQRRRDEAGQTLNYIVANDNTALFTVQPDGRRPGR